MRTDGAAGESFGKERRDGMMAAGECSSGTEEEERGGRGREKGKGKKARERAGELRG